MTQSKPCETCDGTGKTYTSCCGVEMYGSEYEDYDICPTCKEHLGGEEECEDCGGTGVEKEVPVNVLPLITPPWWNDLYIDGAGNSFSDADPGL